MGLQMSREDKKMILEICEKLKGQDKSLYIRGTTWIGVDLGIFLDQNGIRFEGYVDKDPKKWGKVIYGEHRCYSPSHVTDDSFVFIAVKEEKNREEIALELEQAGIAHMADVYPHIYDCLKGIDDEFFLRNFFEAMLGYKLNLEAPATLCEKLQWLKLYYHDPLYTTMVDKYAVKKYVGELIGKEYVIPALGVWDSFDEIDIDSLPDQFVLKWTNDSGSLVVIEDKAKFDRDMVKARSEENIGQNYFYYSREWPYKNVKPRIIAEPYIDSLGKADSIEYKVTCFNGRVGFVTICQGIPHSTFDVRTNDSYTVDFEHMPWYSYYKNSEHEFKRPEFWDDLIALSERLALEIPYLRVDWYAIDGRLYFGEATFYTWGGFIEFTPPEWDLKLGECLRLPDKPNTPAAD